MTRADMSRLLTLAAAFDNRMIDEAMIEAWFAAIGDYDFDDAKGAVASHYRSSPDRLMPSHVTQFVAEQRHQLVEASYMARQRELLASYRIPDDEKPTGPTQAFLDAKAVLVRAGNVPPADDVAGSSSVSSASVLGDTE